MTELDASRFAFPSGEDLPGDRALRRRLGLERPTAPPGAGPGAEFVLARHLGRLELTWRGHDPPLTVAVDLERGELARRLGSARRRQPLARAVGLHRRRPAVVDATAGLGRDALVLQRLGAEVTAVERHPVLAALLADALQRAGREEALRVVTADAADWLLALPDAERPEVVYLDPMFGPQAGRAQVRKEMQVCRALLAEPGQQEQAALFRAARRVARERVVVKRHRKLPPVEPGVDFAVRGRRVRFDVYLQRRSPPPRQTSAE